MTCIFQIGKPVAYHNSPPFITLSTTVIHSDHEWHLKRMGFLNRKFTAMEPIFCTFSTFFLGRGGRNKERKVTVNSRYQIKIK